MEEQAQCATIEGQSELPPATAWSTEERINEDGSEERKRQDVKNTDFAQQDYWEERFTEEESYEWLLSFQELRSFLEPYLVKTNRLLLVGCGNSDFSADLYDAGFQNIVNIDFSETVIDRMREKNVQRTGMEWTVMDMTDMVDFQDGSFDAVVDKAAMDAFMTEEGDVWNPDEAVVAKARSMCQHIRRIVKPGGYHLQISFQQPHFRKKYLLGWHGGDDSLARKEDHSDEFGWSFETQSIQTSEGCFHHFMYVMKVQDLVDEPLHP